MVLCRQYAYNMQIRQTIIITAGKDLKRRQGLTET